MTKSIAPVAVAFAFSTGVVFAQAAQPPLHAPDGGTREILVSIVVPPLPDAPFSAVVATEWTKYLADGSTQILRNHRLIARDGQGRVFQERRTFVPDGSSGEPQLSRTEHADPVAHTIASCDPRVWICELRSYAGLARVALPPAGESANGAASLVRDSLGSRTVEGLELIGTRETQTIAPTVTGTNHPLVVVKEFWYSPRLGINVLTDRADPRSGKEVFTVSEIRLSEPASNLFQPPVSFRIVDLRVTPSPQARKP
jgi:hypothetical protein